MELLHIGAVCVISVLLSLICWKLKMLTVGGGVASLVTGIFVGIVGSLEWFALLVVFSATGFIATKLDFERKKKAGVQEGVNGERTAMNVIGVGLPPCIIAAIAWLFQDLNYVMMSAAYIGTMAVATADTIASEIGIRDEKVWLITSFKKVDKGTNGGISVLGTVSSLAASFIISVVGWIIVFHTLDVLVLIPTLAGFAGNLLDSVFGATLESRGLISKYTNNMSTALVGAVLCVVIFVLFV